MTNGNGKLKILFCTPHNGFVHPDYTMALFRTQKKLGAKYDFGYLVTSSACVYANRNKLIQGIFDNNGDYALFIDSDMRWDAEDVEKLIAFGKDIAVGVAYTRNPMCGQPHAPSVYRYDADHTGWVPVFDLPDTPFKVDAAGAAFMLVKVDVLRKLMELEPKIGFPFDPLPFEQVRIKRPPDTQLVGEDFSFCVRARKAGFDVWCVPSVHVGHRAEEWV